MIRENYKHLIQMRAMDEVAENEFYELEGKAVTFDEATVLFRIGGIDYQEIISSEAFNQADMSDVFLKFNHENSWISCARTKNGTLTIEVRNDGVYIKARLKKDLRWCDDLYKAVRAGLIDKMSFAFSIADNGEEYDPVTHIWTIRQIDKIYDVAAVEIPAYDNTYIYARRKDEVENYRKSDLEHRELEYRRKVALAKIKQHKK